MNHLFRDNINLFPSNVTEIYFVCTNDRMNNRLFRAIILCFPIIHIFCAMATSAMGQVSRELAL
uniref:Uncharacterized protein n=1 Tax=Rhizophora mucronata TaxID=61149 RepID=A0A2P2PAX6_RHIMU